MELTGAQLGSFRENGFANLGKIFSDEELTDIAAEYDRLVTFEAQTLGNDVDGRFPYRAMLNFRSPALKRFINHRALMPAMVQLLGPNVRFWWDQGINKAPGSGSYIPWHQDNGYHNGAVPEYVTCWLALDDSSLENGGLMAIPGSHKRGNVGHVVWNDVHWMIPDVDESNAVPLDADAGDMLIFSSLLFHQTVGNTTPDRHRRSWVMQYAKADVVNGITGETYDNRMWVVRDGAVLDEPFSERAFDLRANVNRDRD